MNRNYSYWDIIVFALLSIAVVFMLIGFMSCNPVKKAQRIMDSNPAKSAEYCAVRFPSKDSIVIRDSVHFDTLYNEYVYIDSIEVKGDSVFVYKVKEVPKLVTKTVTKVREVYRENTAKLRVCEDEKAVLATKAANLFTQKEAAEAEADKWRKTARSRFWWLLLVIGGVAGYVFRNPIKSVIKKLV